MRKLVATVVTLVTLTVAGNALALGDCPDNYAPLPSHPEVCVPAHKNLGKVDRIVNRCVADNLNKVETEYAAKQLAKTCADLVVSGQNWRTAFR